MLVKQTNRLSNPFSLEYRKRDTIRLLGGALRVHQTQRERAGGIRVHVGLASGLLQGDDHSGYHHRDKPDENQMV